MSNLYKLGLRDLPLDEVILIKAIFRLSHGQLSHLWLLVDEGPVDAWITDSASWDADLARQADSATRVPVLYLSRIHNSAFAPTLVRPIRAHALVQWLVETASDLHLVSQVPESAHWADTEPASLPSSELSATGQAVVQTAVADQAHVAATPQASVKTAVIVTAQAVAAAQANTHSQAASQAARSPNADPLVGPQLDHESRYLLRRWPPAQIMGSDPKRLRITSLLSKQALQVDELSNLSGASLEECEGWMSTLLHSELLDTRAGAAVASSRASKQVQSIAPANGQAQGPTTTLAPKKALSLVGAIRRRLGI